MVLVRLDQVQVAAPPDCESAARRFYGDLLGLTELEKPAALHGQGGLWFQIGQLQLHVGVEVDFRPARKAHPAFVVDNLDELAGQLAAAGATIKWDDAISGVRRFFSADLFGNRLEFIAG